MPDIKLNGQYIEADLDYKERHVAKEIDGYRWNAKSKVWKYPISPATARHLVRRFGEGRCSEDVLNLHEQFEKRKRAWDIRDNRPAKELPPPKVRKTDPWEHQKKAYHFAKPLKKAALWLSMGTGKSKITVDLKQNRGHKFTLIYCPKSVIGVWPSEFKKHWEGKLPYIAASTHRRVDKRVEEMKQKYDKAEAMDRPWVGVLNYASVLSDSMYDFIKERELDLITLDECFPSNAEVLTLNGWKRFDSLGHPPRVLSYNESLDKYEWMQSRKVYEHNIREDHCFYRINFQSGDFLICTGNHKIYTEERGYVEAKTLRTDETVRSLRGRLHTQSGKSEVLREGMCKRSRRRKKERKQDMPMVRRGILRTESDSFLWEKLFRRMENESTRAPSKSLHGRAKEKNIRGKQGKDEQGRKRMVDQEKQGTGVYKEKMGRISKICRRKQRRNSFTSRWWKRNRTNKIRAKIIGSFRSKLASQLCGQYGNKERRRLPDALQNRCGSPRKENWDRSGWYFTQNPGKKETRQKKGGISRKKRVDNIEVLERGDCERFGFSAENDQTVYDLNVPENHNYFVRFQGSDPILVSNSHNIKAPGGKQSRTIYRLHKQDEYKLLLSGTPMPHSPDDIYAQYRFLDPGIFGTSHKLFQNKYAIKGGYEGKEIVGWKNEREFNEKIYSVAIKIDKDVLDLPEAVDIERRCQLSEKERSTYDELENDMISFIEKEKEERGVVSADNVLVKLLRLQQITGGFVTDDDGETVRLGGSKASLLESVLEEIQLDGPIVVFARFKKDLENIRRIAENEGRDYAELSGSERSALGEDGVLKEKVGLAGVQIQAGKEGVDFSPASVAIYYSMGFSLGDYKQSRARLARPGQTESVRFIHLMAENTVDEKVLQALEAKQDVIDYILEGVMQSGSAQRTGHEAARPG